MAISSWQFGGHGVHKLKNFIELDDLFKWIDFVAKSESLVYSVDAAIFLRLNELAKVGGPNPFFGTRYLILNNLAVCPSWCPQKLVVVSHPRICANFYKDDPSVVFQSKAR